MSGENDDGEQPQRKVRFDLMDRVVGAVLGLLVAGMFGFFIGCLGIMPNKRTAISPLLHPDGTVSGWFWVIGLGGALFGAVVGFIFPALAFAVGDHVSRH
jgi:hypothetical protein